MYGSECFIRQSLWEEDRPVDVISGTHSLPDYSPRQDACTSGVLAASRPGDEVEPHLGAVP